MCDHRLRSVNDGKSRIPHSPAQINFLKVIKELTVKSPKLFQEVTAEHDATTGLPVDKSLRHSIPSGIDIGNEQIGKVRERPQVQSRNPTSPNCWEGSPAMLK